MGRSQKSFGNFGSRALVAALLATTALVGSVGTIPSEALAQASAQTTFNIPAGPLNRALAVFGSQSGTQISYEASVAAGKTSPGFSGVGTRQQAIAQILRGSGLTFSFTDARNVLITRPGRSNGPVSADGSTLLDTIDVQGRAESAWGPVNGYVAKQSATGTKTDTPLIETPQSISVVGREEMEDRGVQTFGEAIRYTPGVVTDFNGAVQNGGDSLYIRGFGGDLYLDGLQNAGWLEPYGTERIEVLRGPASVLYGQGAPGGLANAVSKRPTDKTIREVGILTNEYGGIQGAFDFGGKLTNDGTLLYRLTGLGKQLGTQFVSNSKLERVYIAPAITWKPTADTTLTILAKYQYDPGFLALALVPYRGSVVPRSDGFRYGPRFYESDPAFDAGSYRRTSQIGYAFEHRFNDVFTVRQNLRYTHWDMVRQFLGRGNVATDTETSYPRRAQRNFTEVDHFVVDTQVQAKFSTGPIQHTALVGIDYRDISTTNETAPIVRDGVPPMNIFNPQYGLYSGPAAAFNAGTRQSASQLGLYAQDHLKWGNLSLLLGGRYDWADSQTYNAFGNRALTSEMSQKAFTGRAGLVYEFANGIAPYASYAESFEPQAGTTAPERGGEPFAPTTGRQYEVGVKYQPTWFNGFFTAAWFDLRKQNVPSPDPIYLGQAVQMGEVTTRGVEFTATAHLTNELKLIASYSYNDNVVTKDNPNSAGISQVGKAPYGIPKNSASAWLDYTFSDGPLAGLGLGAGIRYRGESWGDAANTPSLIVPAYTLVDAAIRYDFGKKWPQLEGLRASINAINLFNKEFVQTCYSAQTCYYGQARTIMGSLTYRW